MAAVVGQSQFKSIRETNYTSRQTSWPLTLGLRCWVKNTRHCGVSDEASLGCDWANYSHFKRTNHIGCGNASRCFNRSLAKASREQSETMLATKEAFYVLFFLFFLKKE